MVIIYNVIVAKVRIGGYVAYADSVYGSNLPHHTYMSSILAWWNGYIPKKVEKKIKEVIVSEGGKVVGDKLGDLEVTEIKEVIRRGAYAPITQNGKINVNGVKASCYVKFLDYSLFDQQAAFHALMTPIRMGFVTNWSNDGSRAGWLATLCPKLTAVKHTYSPFVQYLISFISVPIYALALFCLLFAHSGVLVNAGVVGFVAYKTYKNSASKVKSI